MPQRLDSFARATVGYAPQMRPVEAPDLPVSPPREVLAALDTTAGVLKDLDDHKLALHVEVNDANVRLELRDAEGGVVCELPPVYALDLLSREAGAPTAGGESPGVIR